MKITSGTSYLTGDLSISYIGHALLFLSLAIFVVKWVKYIRRDKGQVRQSQPSIKYWLKDNWMDVLGHIVLALLTVRFTSEFVSFMGERLSAFLGVQTDPMWQYVVIGLNFQLLIELIKKIGRK